MESCFGVVADEETKRPAQFAIVLQPEAGRLAWGRGGKAEGTRAEGVG